MYYENGRDLMFIFFLRLDIYIFTFHQNFAVLLNYFCDLQKVVAMEIRLSRI